MSSRREPGVDDSELGEWLTTGEAGRLLGVRGSQVAWLVRQGRLPGAVHPPGGVIAIPRAVVLARRDRDEGWVSVGRAAEILGCHTATAWDLAVSGRLVKREVPSRGVPSISLASVEQYVCDRAIEQQAELERRAQAEAEREAKRARSGPPPDGQVWLDPATAALVLRLSRSRVQQLVAEERIPGVKRGGRWWLPRSSVEQIAAGRALRARYANPAPTTGHGD